jgi:hypothetical protein
MRTIFFSFGNTNFWKILKILDKIPKGKFSFKKFIIAEEYLCFYIMNKFKKHRGLFFYVFTIIFVINQDSMPIAYECFKRQVIIN